MSTLLTDAQAEAVVARARGGDVLVAAELRPLVEAIESQPAN